MDINLEQDRQKLFKETLKEICGFKNGIENQEEVEELYAKLEKVYMGESNKIEFRHYYSDIFPELCIKKDENGSIEYIGDNLRQIYDFATKQRNKILTEAIKKLYDHTNLEIQRINYTQSVENRIDINDRESFERLQDLQSNLNEAETKFEDVSKKIDNSYSNYIAILGIFAGIVMVFSGGTSFFSKVIANMNELGLARSVFVSSVTGIVIFDIIFMFIYFISKLTEKDISAYSYDVSYKPLVLRFKYRYPLVYVFNIIMLCVGIVSGIVAKYGKVIADGNLWKKIINEIVGYNKMLLLVIGVFVTVNLLFLISYVIAKILEKDIGSNIYRTYPVWFDWEQQNDKIFVLGNGETVKEYDNIRDAQKYINRKRIVESSKATFINVFKVVFLRFPYMTFLNLLAIVAMIIICFKTN